MRFQPDWGTGPPIAHIEDRRLLRYRRVVVPANRVQWYKSLFGKEGLFRPARSARGAVVLQETGRRKVSRFDDPSALKQGGHMADAGGGVETQVAVAKSGLVLKEERYPFPTLLHGLLTVPRVEREFHNLLALRSLGFPAVEPLACGHSGLWVLYHRSFLITREAADTVDLKGWSKGRAPWIGREELAAALLDFAGDVARLHKARCYVRTLFGRNLLARRGDAGQVDLLLCDVPRLWWFRGRGLSFHLAARDLACLDKWARLVFSPRERLRFLKVYLERLGEGPSARRWARVILKKREKLLKRGSVRRFHRTLRRKVLRPLGIEHWWPF